MNGFPVIGCFVSKFWQKLAKKRHFGKNVDFDTFSCIPFIFRLARDISNLKTVLKLWDHMLKLPVCQQSWQMNDFPVIGCFVSKFCRKSAKKRHFGKKLDFDIFYCIACIYWLARDIWNLKTVLKPWDQWLKIILSKEQRQMTGCLTKRAGFVGGSTDFGPF